MKILIIGPNGSGKGTLAKKLAKKLHLNIITSSEELAKAKLDIGTGKLISDVIVDAILLPILSSKKDYILDGYPRTLHQLHSMIEHGISPDLIIGLDIDENTILKRSLGRVVCSNCNESYNLNGFKIPQKPGICDLCGFELITRQDDKEDVIKKRFAIYLEKTKPILDWYTYSNCPQTTVWTFDGARNSDNIARDILDYLNYLHY